MAGRPRDCHLDGVAYLALLRERATAAAIDMADDEVRAAGPSGSVLAIWNGSAYRITPLGRGRAVTTRLPANEGISGAAIFTWRGDYRATGWLSAYSQMAFA